MRDRKHLVSAELEKLLAAVKGTPVPGAHEARAGGWEAPAGGRQGSRSDAGGGKGRVNGLYSLVKPSRYSPQCACECCDLRASDTDGSSAVQARDPSHT